MSEPLLPIAGIVVGVLILFFGRRLFWLFVAGVGFVVGVMLASEWLDGVSDLVTLLIGLAAGVRGAILSVFLQRASVAIAGFLSAGYLLCDLARGSGHESIGWIAFLVGGVIGAVLVMVLFDWALIGLSALSGATLITQNAGLDSLRSALLFFALLTFGVIVQFRQMKRAAPAPKKA